MFYYMSSFISAAQEGGRGWGVCVLGERQRGRRSSGGGGVLVPDR